MGRDDKRREWAGRNEFFGAIRQETGKLMILLEGCYEKGLDEKRLYELGWDEVKLSVMKGCEAKRRNKKRRNKKRRKRRVR